MASLRVYVRNEQESFKYQFQIVCEKFYLLWIINLKLKFVIILNCYSYLLLISNVIIYYGHALTIFFLLFKNILM